MAITHDGDDPLDADLLLDQTRDEPIPALIHQHVDVRDPLDEAIIEEHLAVEEDPDDVAVREELVELVIARVQDDGPQE